MRELYMGSAVIQDDRGHRRSFDYAIVVSPLGEPLQGESYGLRVTERGTGETCTVPHITVDVRRIEALCLLVMRGSVTPVTLRDVVEDWL